MRDRDRGTPFTKTDKRRDYVAVMVLSKSVLYLTVISMELLY